MDAPDCRHCPHSEKSGQHHCPHGPEPGDYRGRPGPRPARYGGLCCDKERRLYGDKNHASSGRKKQYVGQEERRRPRPWRPLHAAARSAALWRLRERSERTAAVRRGPERYCWEWHAQSCGSPHSTRCGRHVSGRYGNSRKWRQSWYRCKARPGQPTARRRTAANPEAGTRQRGTGAPGSTKRRAEIFCAPRLRNGNAKRPKPVWRGRRYKRPRRGSVRRRRSRTAGSAAAPANSSCTAWCAAAGWWKRQAGNGRIPEIVCRTYGVGNSYRLGFLRAVQHPNQHTADAGGKAHSPGRDAKDFPAARSYRCWAG